MELLTRALKTRGLELKDGGGGNKIIILPFTDVDVVRLEIA